MLLFKLFFFQLRLDYLIISTLKYVFLGDSTPREHVLDRLVLINETVVKTPFLSVEGLKLIAGNYIFDELFTFFLFFAIFLALKSSVLFI